jgi:hypothetical protein
MAKNINDSFFIGNFKIDERGVHRHSPDTIVFLNGVLDIPSCHDCKTSVPIQDYITSVSVDLGTASSSCSAQISLSLPRDIGNPLFRDNNPIIGLGMEVNIFMRGYFPIKGMFSKTTLLSDYSDIESFPYYPVFHGLITDMSTDYSGGLYSINLTCESMLSTWNHQKMSTSGAWLAQGGTNSKLGNKPSLIGGNFNNKNPYSIIYELFHSTFGAADGAGFALEQKTNIGQKSSFGGYMFEHAARYWSRRFSEGVTNLRMFGASGQMYNGLQQAFLTYDTKQQRAILSRLSKDETTTNPIGSALRKLLGRTQSSDDLYAVGDKVVDITQMVPFVQDLATFGNVDLFESTYNTKMDIVNNICTLTGYEFFQDVDGDMVFKPPFYNMDVKGNRFYTIEDADIISLNTAERQPEATYCSIRGGHFENLTIADLTGEWGVRGDYYDWRLISKYGFRQTQYDTSFINDARTMYYYAINKLDWQNRAMHSATVTIPLRPEIRVGYPVYIRHLDSFYYVESFSHSFAYGSDCTTSLQLVAKRSKFLPPTNVQGDNVHLANMYGNSMPLRDEKGEIQGLPDTVMAFQSDDSSRMYLRQLFLGTANTSVAVQFTAASSAITGAITSEDLRSTSASVDTSSLKDDTGATMGSESQENATKLKSKLLNQGFSQTEAAAILAIVYKESGFKPRIEDPTYTVAQAKTLWGYKGGPLVDKSDAEIADMIKVQCDTKYNPATDAEAVKSLFGYVYAHPALKTGSTGYLDAWNHRGAGLNGITGGSYSAYAGGKTADQLKGDVNASVDAAVNLFKDRKNAWVREHQYPPNPPTVENLIDSFYFMNRGTKVGVDPTVIAAFTDVERTGYNRAKSWGVQNIRATAAPTKASGSASTGKEPGLSDEDLKKSEIMIPLVKYLISRGRVQRTAGSDTFEIQFTTRIPGDIKDTLITINMLDLKSEPIARLYALQTLAKEDLFYQSNPETSALLNELEMLQEMKSTFAPGNKGTIVHGEYRYFSSSAEQPDDQGIAPWSDSNITTAGILKKQETGNKPYFKLESDGKPERGLKLIGNSQVGSTATATTGTATATASTSAATSSKADTKKAAKSAKAEPKFQEAIYPTSFIKTIAFTNAFSRTYEYKPKTIAAVDPKKSFSLDDSLNFMFKVFKDSLPIGAADIKNYSSIYNRSGSRGIPVFDINNIKKSYFETPGLIAPSNLEDLITKSFPKKSKKNYSLEEVKKTMSVILKPLLKDAIVNKLSGKLAGFSEEPLNNLLKIILTELPRFTQTDGVITGFSVKNETYVPQSVTIEIKSEDKPLKYYTPIFPVSDSKGYRVFGSLSYGRGVSLTNYPLLKSLEEKDITTLFEASNKSTAQTTITTKGFREILHDIETAGKEDTKIQEKLQNYAQNLHHQLFPTLLPGDVSDIQAKVANLIENYDPQKGIPSVNSAITLLSLKPKISGGLTCSCNLPSDFSSPVYSDFVEIDKKGAVTLVRNTVKDSYQKTIDETARVQQSNYSLNTGTGNPSQPASAFSVDLFNLGNTIVTTTRDTLRTAGKTVSAMSDDMDKALSELEVL